MHMAVIEAPRPTVAQKKDAFRMVTDCLKRPKPDSFFPKDRALLIQAISRAEAMNGKSPRSILSIGVYAVKGKMGLHIIPETDTSMDAAQGWAGIKYKTGLLVQACYRDRPHTFSIETRTIDEIGAENVTPVIVLNLGIPPMLAASQLH